MKYKYYILATIITIISVISLMLLYKFYANDNAWILSIAFLVTANIFMWILANTVTVENEIKTGNAVIVKKHQGEDILTDVSVTYSKDYVTINSKKEGTVTMSNILVEYMHKEMSKDE